MATEIVVYHVGGETDEIGPIECVKRVGFNMKLVTFEATEGTCIADKEEDAAFYVNKQAMSSGLYRPNPRFVNEVFADGIWTWGQNTELSHEIPVRNTTIDALMAKGGVQPDVLSIDAQGAELRILRGAEQTLKNTLCCVTEVEFEPIYLGQNLFDEQMGHLRARGFRLMEIFSIQQWHHGPKWGLGFMTVGEAVWLRHDYENLTAAQTETLAQIAAGFGRLSYAMFLVGRLGGKVEDKTLRDLWQFRDHPVLRS